MAENIRVICRVRPMNKSEIARNSEICVSFPGGGSIAVGGKTFTFDEIIQPKATQQDCYEIVAKPIVQDVLNGFNGTIFAYGQTSSGKTFTMELLGVFNDEVLKGMTPRIVDGIFEFIEKVEGDVEFTIKVSYYEIYLEKVADLFDPTKDNLPVCEDKNRVPFVKGGTERFVATPDEVLECLEEGKGARHVTGTNMNEVSSRSHSLFMISVKQDNKDSGQQCNGKLFLVDLAGSEKVAKTGAEGMLLEEAKKINSSLSALGNVINALVEGSNHVPYRDSKLTRILQESLGGNAKTTMIICCSPSSYNEFETKGTLLFGMRAKSIKNQVQANVELTADEWKRRYEKEAEISRKLKLVIESMEAELKKWRAGEKVPDKDQFTEDKYKAIMDDKSAPPKEKNKVELPTDTKPAAKGAPAKAGAAPAATVSNEAASSPKGGGGGGGSFNGPAADELYKQMDEKDEEINNLTQQLAKIKIQLADFQAENEKYKTDNEATILSLSVIKNENDISKGEVKEVLQALEELAVSFDQKAADYEVKLTELEKLQEQVNKLTHAASDQQSSLANTQAAIDGQKKKFLETITELLTDLGDVGMLLNDQLGQPSEKPLIKVEESVTVMRLYISKVKSEAKMMKKKLKDMETEFKSSADKTKESEQLVEQLAMKSNEAEMKLKTATERITELEDKKKALEKQYDDALGQDNKGGNLTQVLNELRKEVEEKGKELESLKDTHNSQKLILDKLQTEHAAMKEDQTTKDKKLDVLEKQTERREQAKAELKGLEENVIRELQSLHSLRKLFIADLKSRIKKASAKGTVQQMVENEDDEDYDIHKGSVLQREKILFLENNLDNLTKIHKQLVRDNADLRCELPKMEKRLKATMERVKQLEIALKESKEGTMRDRKRYQHEVDRIKEAVRQKGLAKAKTNIARPIRAGQKRESINK